MAQQTYKYAMFVRYTCGHTETRQEGGSRRDRDRWAMNLGKNECPACTKARGGGDTIQIDGEDFVIPTLLVGSVKQLSWAVGVRKKIIKTLLDNHRPGDANPLIWLQGKIEAKWWIDNRDKLPSQFSENLRAAA
jgi:hypothetical protein